jgi:hypothetical protein
MKYMRNQLNMDIPDLELSQLNLPDFFSVWKVSVLEPENMKYNNRKDKKKKETKVSQCYSIYD